MILRVVGALIITSFFAILFRMICSEVGIKEAFKAFLFTIVSTSILGFGCYLLVR